jgi:restriction system protein
MLKSPWKRNQLDVTPEQFEKMVVEYLDSLNHDLKHFKVEHQVLLKSPHGDFKMDAVAKFEALGAEFIVLVECKHHKNPIKRELVQVLADKVAASSGHKGMMFSTSNYQRGAIEYAKSRKITLIHFTEGEPVYESRSADGLTGPNQPYSGYNVLLTDDGGITYTSSNDDVLNLLFEDGG